VNELIENEKSGKHLEERWKGRMRGRKITQKRKVAYIFL